MRFDDILNLFLLVLLVGLEPTRDFTSPIFEIGAFADFATAAWS